MIGVGSLDRLVPLSMVVSASRVPNRHGVDVVRIRLTDGTVIDDAGTWDSFEMTPVQLLPAADGTELVRPWTDGNDPAEWMVQRDPVIAWALCFDGSIRPVTPSGVNGGNRESRHGIFVKMPDGTVESCSDWADYGGFPSVDAMLDQLLEDAGKSRAGSVAVLAEGEPA